MNKIKYIFIIICFIIIFLLGKSCNSSKKEFNKPVIAITHYKDTIFPKDTIYILKEKSIPYPVYIDTNTYNIQPLDSLELNRFFIYKDSIEDSNIKMYSNIITQGKTLKSFKPSYKLKIPLIIKDSVVIKKDSIIFKPNKYELHLGILTSLKFISPTIDLSINRSTYTLGYDYINKTPIVGFKYRLWKSKK